MQLGVEDQLSQPVTYNEEGQSDLCRECRDFRGHKANEHNSEYGHIEESIHRLHIGIKPIPGENDARSDEHGGKADDDLKSFGHADQSRFADTPGIPVAPRLRGQPRSFFQPGFIHVQDKQRAGTVQPRVESTQTGAKNDGSYIT